MKIIGKLIILNLILMINPPSLLANNSFGWHYSSVKLDVPYNSEASTALYQIDYISLENQKTKSSLQFKVNKGTGIETSKSFILNLSGKIRYIMLNVILMDEKGEPICNARKKVKYEHENMADKSTSSLKVQVVNCTNIITKLEY